MSFEKEKIRNLAIIAHVDHGKTTLVDQLLKKTGVFRQNQDVADRVMDSGELERERGITILSKNTAINYKDYKINVVDTPGHADFGGEVERVLKMVDGVILVVDAFEGAMPQTKFVLKNALDLELSVIVCINKIDKEEARVDEVIDEVLELFVELEASDEQLDSPFVYTSAREGYSLKEIGDTSENLDALLDTIIEHIPAPKGKSEDALQILISTIDYNDYVGRIGIGKVESGVIKKNQEAIIINYHNPDIKKNVKITNLYEFDGLKRQEVESSSVGDIIAISGIDGIGIGDTIVANKETSPLAFVKISEPTIAMYFSVNDSPFAGREGNFLTSRQIKQRLERELHTDVSLKIEETGSADTFKVSGRGELHLSILIERMRREGYEFQVSKPEVLFKDIDGKKHEPIEYLYIDLPNEFSGTVIEKLSKRKGELQDLRQGEENTKLEFKIPARGLISYRGEFLTDTKGTGIMNSVFYAYEPYKGNIETRVRGSIIAFENGVSTVYGLLNAQERGELFIGPTIDVYKGMVVGVAGRQEDIEVNVSRKKQLSNMRAVGSDETVKLVKATDLSLEKSLEFIADDELLEVTPKNLRIRKSILDKTARMRASRK